MHFLNGLGLAVDHELAVVIDREGLDIAVVHANDDCPGDDVHNCATDLLDRLLRWNDVDLG